MFTLDTTIDAIQTGKKQFVNTVFAQNKTIADALNGFVDAQAAYTKQAMKAGTEVATTLAMETVKAAEEVSKMDFSKMSETFTKSFKAKK
jgi:hypothetical protein